MAGARRKTLPPLGFPGAGAYHIMDVRVPVRCTDVTCDPDGEGCVRLDLTVGSDGRWEEVRPQGALSPRAPMVQAAGRQLWPGFVDIHAHLDKTATWHRAPNKDGTFDGAIDASREARRLPWSEDDVFARMEEAADEAYRMGTIAVRTHIDSSLERGPVSWKAFRRLKTQWRKRLTIQGVVLFVAQDMMGEGGTRLARIAADHGAAFGPVVYTSPSLEAEIARAFELAERHGLDLDFHVDEAQGEAAHGLSAIADMALARKFRGRIVCGHACSLSLHDDAAAARTIARLREANAGVVSLPATNLYLQGRRPGRTPVWRGVTRLHELRAAGVPVAVAGDNRRDAFYPFGDYDMVDVFRDAIRIAHLDMPMAGWVDSVSRTPASLMGFDDLARLVPGAVADFLVFPNLSAAEVLAQRGHARQIVRHGKPLNGRP